MEPAPPEPASRHAKTQATKMQVRREAFRAWRHSRPFWGGFLLVLAGIELLALPLSGLLLKGALKLVIYIGIGGVFGVLIGALLIVAGIVLWVNPTHRVFYGITGIVLGILSFPTSNLGGFFIAMLLAIIGGALAFAWVEADPVQAGPSSAPGSEEPSEAADHQETGRWGSRFHGPVSSRFHGRGGGGSSGHRVFAIAAMPALLVAGTLSASTPAATPQSGGLCILGLICLGGSSSPSPSPSSSPTPLLPLPTSSPCPSVTPTPTPTPSPSPTPTPTPSPSCSPSAGRGGSSSGASPSPGASGSQSGSVGSGKSGKKKARSAKQVADPGLTAPSATSVLTAGSATLTHFAFKGITNMPVGGGGTQKMMEFTASSATLSGKVTVTVTENGVSTITNSPTLGFSQNMTLYATKLCGKLAGIPLCFTPSTVSAVLLSIANLLTGLVPITLTDVTTDQPLAIAGGLRTGSLSIGF
jgi:hypothetical protein